MCRKDLHDFVRAEARKGLNILRHHLDRTAGTFCDADAAAFAVVVIDCKAFTGT